MKFLSCLNRVPPCELHRRDTEIGSDTLTILKGQIDIAINVSGFAAFARHLTFKSDTVVIKFLLHSFSVTC
ncbi:MAG: hypothetical protein ACE5HC_04860 [Candidatus Binatia bacterium]